MQVNSSEGTMDAQAISSAVASFSARFYNELDKSKNLVSSPLSAEYLLALLTLGSTDPAHEELLKCLEFPDDDSIRSSFENITTSLKPIEGSSSTLKIANQVYLKEGPYTIYPELDKDAAKVFHTSFESLNFNNGPGSVEKINKWVESKTNDRIKDLLHSNSIDSSTRVVLISALYFKGTWKIKFMPENTKELPFQINKKTTIDISMMYTENKFKYGVSPDLRAQILVMPFESEQASMVIVLPDGIESLNDVLKNLADGYDLLDELKNMTSTNVKVTLPKFNIETEIDLTKILPKLGVHAIFDKHNSGLTKVLVNDESLSVSVAVQKAFIEVNEEGAEAAASSGVELFRSGAAGHTFYANRPFVYLVTGVDNNILLMGVFRGIA